MMPWLKEQGTFKGKLVDAGLVAFDGSKSLAVRLKFDIVSKYTPAIGEGGETVTAWAPLNPVHHFEDKVFIVGKAGSLLERGASTLAQCLGWDGNLAGLGMANFHQPECQLVVAPEAGQKAGTVFYNLKWLNPIDNDPSKRGGGTGSKNDADEAAAKTAQAQYGAQLRAIVGTAKHNATPPPADPVAAVAEKAGGEVVAADDVPF
jgi:hypothetical protein